MDATVKYAFCVAVETTMPKQPVASTGSGSAVNSVGVTVPVHDVVASASLMIVL